MDQIPTTQSSLPSCTTQIPNSPQIPTPRSQIKHLEINIIQDLNEKTLNKCGSLLDLFLQYMMLMELDSISKLLGVFGKKGDSVG